MATPHPVFGHLHALSREVACSGRHRAAQAALCDVGRDLVPVVAEVGLSADERHLAHADLGELIDDAEALLGGQLYSARLAGARAARTAAEVARERDLPDAVERVRRVVLARVRRACEVARVSVVDRVG